MLQICITKLSHKCIQAIDELPESAITAGAGQNI